MGSRSNSVSTTSTPGRGKFVLVDLSLKFPHGKLSLVCGKLGSGKTLLLLGESRFSLSFAFPSFGFPILLRSKLFDLVWK